MRYTKNILHQEIVRNSNSKSKDIKYIDLKRDLEQKYLTDTGKIENLTIDIVSGELNIFIYRKDISTIRNLVSRCDSSSKLNLYIYNEVLVDANDKDGYKHQMVDAINNGIDKTIYITDKKVPVQLICVQDTLYIYGFHTRYELNYKSLSKQNGYKDIAHLEKYGDLRDEIEVIKIELDKKGREILDEYLKTLKDMTKKEHIIKDKFIIDDEIVKAIPKTVQDMLLEYESDLAFGIYKDWDDKKLSYDEFKKFNKINNLDSYVQKEVYKRYTSLYAS